jgi:hypothetical protein
VCDPRAATPGGHGLKSGENGHLARANILLTHQPGPVCVEGGVSRWLAGVLVFFLGGGGCTSAATRGVGR